MPRYNPNNERVKREYLKYLKEAKRHSEATLDAVTKALARFEADTGYRDFKRFHREQAIAFKERLAAQESQATGDKLSQATRYATLAHLRRFVEWLAGRPGYKSRIHYADAEYFNISEKDARVAKARRQRPCPTVQEVKDLIACMPITGEVERRNRALIAFTLLTGARDSAIASLKLKHVDLEQRCVFQDARDVNTKFSKTFTTYFFPVGDEILEIFQEWVLFLRREKQWEDKDPLFPATRVVVGIDNRFESDGVSKAHWSDSGPIRAIFRQASKAAGMPYFNPHSLRSTLARLGETICTTPETFKAWSQNLGHEGVLTTFLSYGAVSGSRQADIIRSLAEPASSAQVDPQSIQRLLSALNASGLQITSKQGSG